MEITVEDREEDSGEENVEEIQRTLLSMGCEV